MHAFAPEFFPLTSSLAASLVTAIAETALLAIAAALLLRLVPAMSPGVRSRIWLGVFLAAMLMPFAVTSSGTHDAAMRAEAPVRLDAHWAFVLLAAWILASAYRAVRLVQSGLLLRRIARLARPFQPEAEFAGLLTLPGSRLFGRRVELCLSDEVDVPSVAGFLRPRILIPAALEGMDMSDLRQIVLHEMEHLRRNDDWTNLLQKIGLVLLPLNPVLFWIDRRLCVERELACDDGVIRRTGAGKAYATCLTNLAEQTMLRRGLRRGMLLALGAWQRQSELSRRVLRVLAGAGNGQRVGRGQAVLSAVLCVGAVAGGAVELARMPRLVTFGAPPVVASAVPVETGIAAPTFVPGGSAAMRRVSAVMPERRVEQGTVVPAHVATSRRVVHRSPRRVARVGSWMLLTSWHEPRSGYRRQVVLRANQVLPDSHFTYAAVPVGDGWLVIQL